MDASEQNAAAQKMADSSMLRENIARVVSLVVALICAVVVSATTFMDALSVPPIGQEFGATLFEITPYVLSLNDTYGMWLPDMLQEPAGSNMQLLLQVGSVAMIAVEALSIIAIALFVVYAVMFLINRRRLAKIFGILAFSFGLLLPVVFVAVQAIVNGLFSNEFIGNVVLLKTLPAMYVRLGFGIAGLVAVIISTRKNREKQVREN